VVVSGGFDLVWVAYNYTLNLYVRFEGERYGGLLRILSFVFHSAFLVAVLYLFLFGLGNI
jgi:hypothetical protein